MRANLEGGAPSKANLDQVRARDACFRSANLLRCEFYGADLRGAVVDGATMLKTSFHGADLRSCSLRDVHFDRTSFDEATFGANNFMGAEGTIHRAGAFIDTADGIVPATAGEVLAFLRAAGGTGVTFVDEE